MRKKMSLLGLIITVALFAGCGDSDPNVVSGLQGNNPIIIPDTGSRAYTRPRPDHQSAYSQLVLGGRQSRGNRRRCRGGQRFRRRRWSMKPSL